MPRLIPTLRRTFRQNRHVVLDLSHSANLYLTQKQGLLYEKVLADDLYRQSVAGPLARAGEALPALLQRLTNLGRRQQLTVVDCGPATANESVCKLSALRQAVRISRYIAIDVNARLLSNVRRGVLDGLGFPVTTIRKRFEELDSSAFRQYGDCALLMLFGSTCMNYEQIELRNLMKRLSFPGMLVSLETMLRATPQNSLSSREYESEAVIRFAFGPLELMGADFQDFAFHAVAAKGRVSLEFTARRKIQLEHPGMPHLRSGDKVWTAFSRRPTLLDHQSEMARFVGRFDTFVMENQVAASLGRVG